MIRAGELRDRVGLLAQTNVNDPQWGPTPQWVEVATVWAGVTPVAASEKFAAQGVQSVVSHRVTMRWRADLTSKHRLTYRGRTLDIVGVHDPDGRRRELLIEATEHPAEGGADA